MNYKLLKIVYVTLAAITLVLSFGAMIFIDTMLEVISTGTIIIISACLCFPMFALKVLHEQKYPPTKKDKIFAVIIFMATMLFIFMV